MHLRAFIPVVAAVFVVVFSLLLSTTDGQRAPFSYARPRRKCTGRETTYDDFTNAEVNFEIEHTAHAVTGGPYVATDFRQTGRVGIYLNGRGSHSHGINSFTERPNKVVRWVWKWVDNANPKRDPATGVVTHVGARTKPMFPEGITQLSLMVLDDACNVASDTTTIEVLPAAKPSAYCYFYDFKAQLLRHVPMNANIHGGRRPTMARAFSDVNIRNFNFLPYARNSFVVRCTFDMDTDSDGASHDYYVKHSGPIKVYQGSRVVAASGSYAPGVVSTIKAGSVRMGLHRWQVIYFRPYTHTGSVQFLGAGRRPMKWGSIRYDVGKVLPVIRTVDKKSGLAGIQVKLWGNGFSNNVKVRFGGEIAETTDITRTFISVKAPPVAYKYNVKITVSTGAGRSNGVDFTYTKEKRGCESIDFGVTSIKTMRGQWFTWSGITVIKYGPDGRLYAGTMFNNMLAFKLDKRLRIKQFCKTVLGPKTRSILGLAFNPKSTALKLYFTSSTLFWLREREFSFANGWHNGKVRSITIAPGGCFNNDVKDVVTGLPVSNRDHGVNWLQFMPDGRMLIGIGGSTNGGVSSITDRLGGIPPSPYSGSILECPSDTVTNIEYSSYAEPDNAEVITPGCKIYAPGFRNSFGAHLHTNGNLYCTDNGPNFSFGRFSTNCVGGSRPDRNIPDKLFKVVKGRCHGYPNLLRGRLGNPAECVFNAKQCIQPITARLPSSTNGVIEYRSNLFGGQLKSDLFLTRFAGGGKSTGGVHRVRLNKQGTIAVGGYVRNWHRDSGLSIVEGPRGELIMSRVHKTNFFVLYPRCRNRGKETYFIGVHPKRGPAAGGHRVLISGFNFGTSPRAKFGYKFCSDVSVVDSTQFYCTTPPAAPGRQVKVVVYGALNKRNRWTKGSDYWYW